MDLQFTADMEQKLDAVEEGKIDWRDILNDFTVHLSVSGACR